MEAVSFAAAMQVPDSSGAAASPKLRAPADACDCHMHIYDGARFPPPRPQSRMQPNACVPDYRLFQHGNGRRSRVIVVTRRPISPTTR